ncbi:hypothetical protein SDD30_14335 [Moorella naiadis]|uniref:hypothetical protein n=1 Tax=Moorella naiadis (nom. illeg.) TaxID=3093670 RepID=UPI003D9CAA71
MAKILLGSTPLSSGELDDLSKALLPGLCRSMAISFMEDEAGNLILEPPLGNRMIVLRPLPGPPEQELNLLLTTLSKELKGQGANVLIVPAGASDGQLFRLWQTQVLFAFSQNEAPGTMPGLRFFYAPGKKEASLGLIAALVRAMLSTGDPPTYTIPGTWEHFKNFRYRRLLNNAGVPSVLIEFCRVDLNPAFVHHLSAWLVNGLIQYFQRPVEEATISKLQPLLHRLQDSLTLSGSPDEGATDKVKGEDGELPVRARQAAKGSAEVAAPAVTAPADQAPGVTSAFQENRATAEQETTAKDNIATIMVGELNVGEKVTAQENRMENVLAEEATPDGITIESSATREGAIVRTATEEKEEISRKQLRVSTPTDVTASQGTGQQRGKQQSDKVSAAPAQASKPSAPIPIEDQAVAVSSGTGAQARTTIGGTVLSRPARHRHRSNSFAPPGDGPVFVFQRPPEIARFPSFFPQDVLERMIPTAVQSTFLTGQQAKMGTPTLTSTRSTWQAPLQKQPAQLDRQPVGHPEPLMPQAPPVLSPEPVAVNLGETKPATSIAPDEDNDTTLVELKRLRTAILTSEQLLEPTREPQNGEAPSI